MTEESRRLRSLGVGSDGRGYETETRNGNSVEWTGQNPGTKVDRQGNFSLDYLLRYSSLSTYENRTTR